MKRPLAAALLLASCAQAPAGDPGRDGRESQRGSAPAAAQATATQAAAAQASAAPSAAAEVQPISPAALREPLDPASRAPLDPAQRALAEGRIVALRFPGTGAATCARPNRAAPPGRLEALVDLGGGAPRWIGLWLAHRGRPRAWRRPLAFARLAAALDAQVVPAAVLRRVPIGEIAALLEGQVGGPELARELAVLNDGAVEALALAPAPGAPGPRWDPPVAPPAGPCPRRVIAFEGAPELDTWAAWAASPTPAPGERPALLRGYVEALALDYLSGHVLRRDLVVDDAAGALILEDNAEAFPALLPERGLDRFLGRLAKVARFPRALRHALVRLDRRRAADLLAPGSFAPPGRPAVLTGPDGWLLTPRSLVDLDERRAALLTLIEAKIAARGEAATLIP